MADTEMRSAVDEPARLHQRQESADDSDTAPEQNATATLKQKVGPSVSQAAHTRDESFSRSRYSTISTTFDVSSIADVPEEPPTSWTSGEAAQIQTVAPPETIAEEHSQTIRAQDAATETIASDGDGALIHDVNESDDLDSQIDGPEMPLNSEPPLETPFAGSATLNENTYSIDSFSQPVSGQDEKETGSAFFEESENPDDADVFQALMVQDNTTIPVAQSSQETQLPTAQKDAVDTPVSIEASDIINATMSEDPQESGAPPAETTQLESKPFENVAENDWLVQSSPSQPADALSGPQIEPNASTLDSPAHGIPEALEKETVDPFGDINNDWLGTDGSDEIPTDAHPSAVDSSDPSQHAGDKKDDGNIEDSWAQAFGDDGGDLDTSWGAAFGDDDDGFLDDGSGLLPPDAVPQANNQPPALPPTSNPQTSRSASRYQASNVYASLVPQAPIQPAGPAPPGAASGKSGMKFFEDLPMTEQIKPRRIPRAMPSQASTPTPPPPSSGPSTRAMPPPALGEPRQAGYSSQTHLQPQEKMELFPPQPRTTSAPSQSQPPAATARYSPSPASLGSNLPTMPSSNGRYSPAPPGQRVSSYQPTSRASQALNVPPRTASEAPAPVTTSKPKGAAYEDYGLLGDAPARPPRRDSKYSPSRSPSMGPLGQATAPPFAPLAPSAGTSATPPMTAQRPPSANRYHPRTSSPLAHADPRPNSTKMTQQDVPDALVNNRTRPMSQEPAKPPPRTGNYTPASAARPRSSDDSGGSRTQSPEMSRSRANPYLTQPTISTAFQTAHPETQVVTHVHRATPSNQSNFIPPSDSDAADPLERWKGSPIISWTGIGSIVTVFPRRMPVYSGNQSLIKTAPGEVRLQKTRDLMPPNDPLAPFPGPLKSKSKKKELLSWMATRIEAHQREVSALHASSMDPRESEKLVLWQIMRIFVEHDGTLSGNPAVELAVRQALSPEGAFASSAGGHAEADPAQRADSVDVAAVGEIVRHLSAADREKATWHAVDHRLWGHAMMIASTLNGTLWKQVAQEFIRKEVRGSKRSNQALAALYQTFAGNWEESVDELIPASARAGFTMLSKSEDQSQQQTALEGLEKWRDTVTLILSNRSNGDENSLRNLGQLLTNYGRTEAAHICYLFARSVAVLSGADDPSAGFTLIGADMRSNASNTAGADLESVVLTEIYEFGLTLSSNSGPIPHLQAYKLQHAYWLAENGLKTEAQQYCDNITASFKANTKTSQYYNSALAAQLDDLSKLLSQAPRDGSSGLWSRPGLGKVSGSIWNRFNSFVAGDDGETGSNASGGNPEDNGTFSKWTGGTPTISRTASQTSLYAMQPPASNYSTSVNSRYAPGPARSVSDQAKPVSTYAPVQQGETGSSQYAPFQSASNNYRPSSRQSGYAPSYEPSEHLDIGSVRSHKSLDSYIPSVQEEEPQPGEQPSSPPAPSMTVGSAPRRFAPSPLSSTDAPSRADEGDSLKQLNGHMSPLSSGPADRTVDEYEPPSGGYQPLEGAYEPPQTSYMPFEPDPEPTDEGPDTKPKNKKKSYMDDDEDTGFMDRAAERLKAEEKAKRDRENDELFRKAAAEDDARAQAAAKEKKGWGFGGWFAGKPKDPNAVEPIKAKLGEDNSFVFDPELKKWVNKKAGASQAATPSGPPPPPRTSGGPSSRAVSAAGTPPPPPPGAGGAALLSPSSARPPSGPPGGGPARGAPSSSSPSPRTPSGASDAGSATAAAAAPASGPGPGPARVASGVGNASSIDDLLSVAPARKAGAGSKKAKKRGGYVDIMAK